MVTRSTLAGGPAHISYGGACAHLAADARLELVPTTHGISSSIYGEIDEAVADLQVRCTGQPLTFENLDLWFPYLTPTPGQIYPLGGDTPLSYLSSNGDSYTVRNAVLTKMPELVLGVGDPIFGPLEFTGILGDGLDPEMPGSYYTILTEKSYAAPALNKTKIPRQRYTATWTGVTGFESFQAFDKWTVSWDLKFAPVRVQGRTVAFKLVSVRAMAKCIPVGPTAMQIDAALAMQGAGARHGHRLGSAGSDLVIFGAGVRVTLKGAALKSAGFVFGVQPLRNGEIGFVTTLTPGEAVAIIDCV